MIKAIVQTIFSVKNSADKKHKIIKIFGIKIKINIIKNQLLKNNTFIIWELQDKYHAEIIPGYAKYLLDLGYEVSVILSPDESREGLFSRFKNEKLFIIQMTFSEAFEYFNKYHLAKAKGILITTARNVCDPNTNYQDKINLLGSCNVFIVEHDVKIPVDKNFYSDNMITLAPINYNGKKSVIVNPHYFGDIKTHSKNTITNFAIIGSWAKQRRNLELLFEAARKLNNQNFKITAIGLTQDIIIPDDIIEHFEAKGRLNFKEMYNQLESIDFILALLDETDIAHYRYITTGTSGTYQLCFGFNKPLLIEKTFTENRWLNNKNSLIYYKSINFANALYNAIKMSNENYITLCKNLEETRKKVCKQSLNNLRNLISSKTRMAAERE